MVALVDIQVKKEYGPKYPVLMSDLVSVPGTYICIESLFRWNFYFFHQMINLENMDKTERLIIWMCSTYMMWGTVRH